MLPTDSDLPILAVTTFGLEAVVARELEDLGYQAQPVSTGRVLFYGDALAVCRANLWLRTADRVLIRLAEFPCDNFDTLFDTVKALNWSDWIPRDGLIHGHGRSIRSQLASVPANQRATKKAIVEAMLAQHHANTLPESGAKHDVEIAIVNNLATITLDTSGAGLHKRGYRQFVGEAAIKETLAAGLVYLSAWNPDRPLIDPFCGSGTIAIEAALLGLNIAPGLNREFSSEFWQKFPLAAWIEARREATEAPRGKIRFAIHGSDISDSAIQLAHTHGRAAGVERNVHFAKKDFHDLSSKLLYGCIVTNPPYGERIGEAEQIERLYHEFPIVFRRLESWSFFILTGRLDFEQIIGQQATRRRKLYNSTIECTYYQYLGPKPPSMRKEPVTPHKPEIAPAENAQPNLALIEESPDDLPSKSQDESPDAVAVMAPVTAVVETTVEPLVDQNAPAAPTLPQSDEPQPDRIRRPKVEAGPVFGGLRDRDRNELEQFRATLTNNVRHLRRYPTRGITCFRMYERDSPDVPLIIDRYEGRIHVFEYEREHSRNVAQQADWLDACRDIISEVCSVPPQHVYMKMRLKQRGLTQHEKLGGSNETFEVQEDGLRFWVNLADYTDTGLFLDHRLTRQMIRKHAASKRFLNLFCYTGSFTSYAAAGGAISTTSVDLSYTYLDWAAANLELNAPPGPQHQFIRSDIREWLRKHPVGPHYDLAFVDPPTFSNSKSTDEDWDVLRDHPELLNLVRGVMSPGGVVYFSNNFRRFKLAENLLPGYAIREISTKTVPPEYRNTRIHRCWMLRAIEPGEKVLNGEENAPIKPADDEEGTQEQS